MILYNVTIKVHHSIHTEWLQWLKQEHVPEVMQTNCFTDFKILRLLEIDEVEGPTYAIQYFAESKALYNLYIEKFAIEMRNRSFAKWGDKFIAFRSVMQIVD
jgi:predicted ATP-dependent Lon-type protease